MSGTVSEFRPGGAATGNLTTTEIANPVVTPDGPGSAIAPTVVGAGGRVPPTTVIEDDAGGNVETSGVFDPAQDGIDFYESLEGDARPGQQRGRRRADERLRRDRGVADNGAGAGVRTSRGGIVIRAERLQPGADHPRRRDRRRPPTSTSGIASRARSTASWTTTSATSSSSSPRLQPRSPAG